MLMMATGTRGYTERAAYLCALTEQLAQADGLISILEMETKARTEMLGNKANCKDLTLDTRSALMKKLILPPSDKQHVSSQPVIQD